MQLPTLLMTASALLILAMPAIGQVSDQEMREALGSYQNATRDLPTVDAELGQRLLRRGNTYSNLERHEEAIEEYAQAIIADPNLAEAHRNLANTYFFLDRMEQAKPLYARYIALALDEEPSTALRAAIATLAGMEREQENFALSVVLDLKSIELEPDNDSLVHISGNVYNNAGDAGKAIRIYQAAIQANPENAFFHRTLGRLLEQEGRLEEALAQYELAAAKDPESDFYANLAESLRARLER